MSTHTVLNNENWSDYDNRKQRNGSDQGLFACTESWEVDYLVNKIRNQHPNTAPDHIRSAIAFCCKEVPGPRPRPAFVECVMRRLGLHY